MTVFLNTGTERRFNLSENLRDGIENLHDNSKNLHDGIENLCDNLSVLDRQIVREIVQNPYVTYSSLASQTGKSKETMRVHLNYLRNLGVIQRVGSTKSGSWKVNIIGY